VCERIVAVTRFFSIHHTPMIVQYSMHTALLPSTMDPTVFSSALSPDSAAKIPIWIVLLPGKVIPSQLSETEIFGVTKVRVLHN